MSFWHFFFKYFPKYAFALMVLRVPFSVSMLSYFMKKILWIWEEIMFELEFIGIEAPIRHSIEIAIWMLWYFKYFFLYKTWQ